MERLKRLLAKMRRVLAVPAQLSSIQESLGRIEIATRALHPERMIRDHEFKVYSQWGEDGIIDYLVSNIPIQSKTFVEFGVENYSEANTLFLLRHRYWRGLVIDGSSEHIGNIRQAETFWKFDLFTECSFITRENINSLIERNGFGGDLGLLSVDIDGNDYWVWEAIEVARPRIVVSEYNSLFGPDSTVSIPYDSTFFRPRSDKPLGYFGASISALDHLAKKRGYSLVAGNSAGNNVFFVRNDCMGKLTPMSPAQAYAQAAFRESRSALGQVSMLHFAERQESIAGLPVVDVVTGVQMPFRDCLGGKAEG